MNTMLVENDGNVQKTYDSIIVDPKNIGILRNDLALKVINELVAEPCCAFDIARKLNQHEQKIYYHLRNLEKAGIIKILKTEKRYGMTAKIYKVVSPVVFTKLYDDGHVIEKKTPSIDPKMKRFFHPFIEDGKLNAKIVVGDPNEHGRFDRRSKESSYIIDFVVLLGSFVNQYEFPYYKVDTEISESNLKENLILIGNIRTNVIIDRIKDHLPIEFIEKEQFSLVSKITNKKYRDPRTGFILKIKNPLNHKKSIMIIGGLRTRGTRAALIALTKNMNKICNNENDREILRIVKGFDRLGSGAIDSAEFIE